jgi:hypothetical protein
MFNSKYLLVLVLSGLIFVAGCDTLRKGKFTDEEMEKIKSPVTSELPQPTGGFTLAVGDQKLTVENVLAPRKDQVAKVVQDAGNYEDFMVNVKPAMKTIVSNNIADLLLYQKAQKTLPEQADEEFFKKTIDGEVQKFIAAHNGNYADAQKTVEAMGLDWQGFRDYQKRLIIVQSFIATQTDDEDPVSYDEIVAYYDSVKDSRFTTKASLEFRLIDIVPSQIIVPDVNDVNDPNAHKPDLEQMAFETAQQIMDKIKAGEDFAELAKKYSNDYAAADGGLWKPITPGSLAEPYNMIEDQIRTMKPGDVAGPVKAGDHVFIIRLVQKVEAGTEPFEKVHAKLEKEMKFQKKRQAIDKMLTGLVDQVDSNEIDQFVDFCIKEAYQRYKVVS